jgi:hypothetical protein
MTAFLSLRDAIAEYVQDGATLAMEGFTHLIPFAAGHEIIRQHKSDLCLIRMTPDLICQEPAPWKGAGLLAGASLTLDQSQPPVSTRLTGLRWK